MALAPDPKPICASAAAIGATIPLESGFGDAGATELLIREMQESSRSMACERAEFAQERAEFDAKFADLEEKLRCRQQAHAMLLRRVRMLEQVLHEERRQQVKLLSGRNSHAPPSSTSSFPRPLSPPLGPNASRFGFGAIPSVSALSCGSAYVPWQQLLPGGLAARRRLEERLEKKKSSTSARAVLNSYMQKDALTSTLSPGGVFGGATMSGHSAAQSSFSSNAVGAHSQSGSTASRPVGDVACTRPETRDEVEPTSKHQGRISNPPPTNDATESSEAASSTGDNTAAAIASSLPEFAAELRRLKAEAAAAVATAAPHTGGQRSSPPFLEQLLQRQHQRQHERQVSSQQEEMPVLEELTRQQLRSRPEQLEQQDPPKSSHACPGDLDTEADQPMPAPSVCDASLPDGSAKTS